MMFNAETQRTQSRAEKDILKSDLRFFAFSALLSPNFAHFCKDFCCGARVAQICNLLYRRIAFGKARRAWGVLELATASGLQIRDTAECNSALLWLRLHRAAPLR